jgi:hypothetical protein
VYVCVCVCVCVCARARVCVLVSVCVCVHVHVSGVFLGGVLICFFTCRFFTLRSSRFCSWFAKGVYGRPARRDSRPAGAHEAGGDTRGGDVPAGLRSMVRPAP